LNGIIKEFKLEGTAGNYIVQFLASRKMACDHLLSSKAEDDRSSLKKLKLFCR